MMVIVLENAPARLSGRLSLWLLEIRAGTFVGAYGRRVRERIWEETQRLMGKGSAVMIWSAPTESGFAFASVGKDRRVCVEMDGLTLVSFLPRGLDTIAYNDQLCRSAKESASCPSLNPSLGDPSPA